MMIKDGLDIKYIDLHAVHGTNSIICSLVLDNGVVLVGQAHDHVNSHLGALAARLEADNKHILMRAVKADLAAKGKTNV